MYWSTMCSSATGPLWDLYISTSSEVGTYLEQKSDSHLGGVVHAEHRTQASQFVETDC